MFKAETPAAENGATPSVEAFLTGFHDERPGLTPKAFAALAVTFQDRARASSYHALASTVPATSEPLAVLDLACGDGYLLSLLAARAQPGLQLCGVDLSAGELAAARERLGPDVSLAQARAQWLPYASARFDVVLCHMALMLMDDAERVLREIRRVLKTGGRFGAIVGAPPPPSAALDLHIKAISRHARQSRWDSVRFGDRRLRTREGIAELLAPGFSDVAIEEMHVSLRLTPDGLWLRLLDMYDLYLLDPAARAAVERELHESAAASCGPDGMLDFPIALRYLGATASGA
jgi:SAM-dependent methyltransferase